MNPLACSSREKRAWLLLVFGSLVIRLIDLGHRAMSHDESLHAFFSWKLSHGLDYSHDPMMHGPLLFHLNGLVYAVLGDTDFTSLLFPAFWGTACVAMLFLYRRWLGAAGAFVAAILVSLDPGHLFYSRYLRNDIMVSFFSLIMVWAILDYRDRGKGTSLIWLSLGLGLQFITKETCFIIGTICGAGCIFFALLETRGRDFRTWLVNLLSHPNLHCAMLILLLALPFAGALLLPLLGWDPLDNRSPEGQKRIFLVAGWIWGISLLSGVLYFKRQKKLGFFAEAMGLFWLLQILFYTTLFTKPDTGMASGLAGSLGYWLSQHEVKRGNDDVFFYVTLLLLYTPVLLAGWLLSLRNFFRWPMPFLWFWFIGSLLIYSWAGERMPWLLLHISLPLCLITGTQLAPLFGSNGRWGLKILMALGCFQLVTNSLRVNGPLSEGPWEPLIYAHSGPDIKASLFIVDEHLAQNPGTRAWINTGDHYGYTWPLAWYFRNRDGEYAQIRPGNIPEEVSVLFAPPPMEAELNQAGWTSRLLVDMTTWPRPQYHRITLENIDGVVRVPAVRRKFIRYYLYREQPHWRENEFPGPNRYLLMTR